MSRRRGYRAGTLKTGKKYRAVVRREKSYKTKGEAAHAARNMSQGLRYIDRGQ